MQNVIETYRKFYSRPRAGTVLLITAATWHICTLIDSLV